MVIFVGVAFSLDTSILTKRKCSGKTESCNRIWSGSSKYLGGGGVRCTRPHKKKLVNILKLHLQEEVMWFYTDSVMQSVSYNLCKQQRRRPDCTVVPLLFDASIIHLLSTLFWYTVFSYYKYHIYMYLAGFAQSGKSQVKKKFKIGGKVG